MENLTNFRLRIKRLEKAGHQGIRKSVCRLSDYQGIRLKDLLT